MTDGVSRSTLATYGILGLPFAMAALPVYVYLPKFYGEHVGVSIAVMGLLLLVLRIADAVVDPLLGAFTDRARTRKWPIALAVPFLAIGMVALFSPPGVHAAAALLWLAVALAVVYGALSLATIAHGAWGAEITSDPVGRTRVTAARETFALAGVVIASVVPSALGGDAGNAAAMSRFAWLFAGTLALCAAISLALSPAAPTPRHGAPAVLSDLLAPLRDGHFRRLFAVFVANGIASAIPATLVLFFVADVLRAEAQQGVFLALYFVAAAAGMPLWVRATARYGKVRTWLAAMLLAIASFVWVSFLGAGDAVAFGVVCVASGLAFGADLALAPALLADVIGREGRMQATGAYFGLWTFANKMNLALAAGIALPLLAALGYTPGAPDAPPGALAFVYAGLPCILKLGAIGALAWFNRGWERNA